MKIEIWSDVMCPFCYIGKRHLEKAMEEYNIQRLHSNIQPMSFENFQNDIDQSIFDSENGRVISAEELRTKIKK